MREGLKLNRPGLDVSLWWVALQADLQEALYTEELQEVYGSVFSIEAASLPFSTWLEQIIDALLG